MFYWEPATSLGEVSILVGVAISPARVAAFTILVRIERETAYAGELLHSARLQSLSVPNRSLATELVMGVLRWRSRLDELIAGAATRTIARLDLEVLVALRIAAYQLRFLSRIPAHAAINDSVELVKHAHKRSAAPLVNAVLRKIASQNLERTERAGDAPEDLARGLAHPRWLVERWVASYGLEQARSICSHDQSVPATALRLDNEELADELHAEGIMLAPGALLSTARIVIDGDVTRTRAFADGRIFIHDEASQLVATLVGSGPRVLDCCAAPGGKTAAIAARNPSAKIVAAELHAHRAELLRKRVRAENVQVIQADTLELPAAGNYDSVLADVPCSGTGTLRRNPEIKWRLQPQDIDELHEKQVGILRAALRQLAPGGRAVYSTCSLEREEGENVVQEVLRESRDYRLCDCRAELERLRTSGELVWRQIESLMSGRFLRTIPGVHPCDGFFAAVLERSES